MKVRQIENSGIFVIDDCPGCGSDHAFYTKIPNRNGAIWQFNGNQEQPTFMPSFHAVNSCHFFVNNGMISFCNDSKHKLAGKTVELYQIDGTTY